MQENKSELWKLPEIVKNFLSGTRLAFPGAIQQIEIMLKMIDAGPWKIEKFLDFGCGDGLLGASILDKYPGSKGVFLDFSRDMLTAAEEKLKDFKPRVEIVYFDYSNHAWTTKVVHMAPFDAVVSGYSIHHQPDDRKKEIYLEIFRLLKPGGIFINIEHVLSASDWIGHIHNENFIDSLFEFRKEKDSRDTVSKEFYGRADKQSNILSPVEDQCRWLRKIGYQDVDCYFKIFELCVFGGRKPL